MKRRLWIKVGLAMSSTSIMRRKSWKVRALLYWGTYFPLPQFPSLLIFHDLLLPRWDLEHMTNDSPDEIKGDLVIAQLQQAFS